MQTQPIDALIEALTKAATKKMLTKNITQMTARVARAFAIHSAAYQKTLATFETQFKESISNEDLDNIFDLSNDAQRLIDIINTFVEKGLTLGATALIAQFDADMVFSLDNPRAVAYIGSRGATAVTGIDDESKSQLRTILAAATDDGRSYNWLARAIRQKFNDFSTKRAKLIAVTELGNAYQEGNMIVARDLATLGLPMQKRWLTVGDDRVDADCQANADQEWIDVEETFVSGADRPLSHPHCRCMLQFRRKPSEVSEALDTFLDTAQERKPRRARNMAYIGRISEDTSDVETTGETTETP